MSISFSAADRKSITRRQVRIDLENASYAQSSASFTGQQTALLEVDNGNKKFYDNYSLICDSYENEKKYLDGTNSDIYSPSDLVSAGEFPANAPFFPSTSSPAYARSIPLIQDGSYINNKVKGIFHPLTPASRYELNVLTNTVVMSGLTELIFRLSNGISGASSTTTTSSDAVPAGTITGFVMGVSTTTGFAVNELLYINNGSASGIYKIQSITPGTSLTIDSVVPSSLGIASTATVDNTVLAFTSTERQTLVSAVYQEILTTITNNIDLLVTEWESFLTNQTAAISANPEDRLTQMGQLVSALSSISNAVLGIDTWQSFPNTGLSGKYVSGSIAVISGMAGTRISYASTRASEILNSLGGSSSNALSQSGETYTSADMTNPYYNRYKWLNFRINRMSGSLRRYYAAGQSGGAVTQLAADNTSLKSEYNGYFTTKVVIFNDGSDILHIKDVTGLSNGDTVTVVSETQPEITRTIVSVMGTTQIKLNAIVPTSYTLEDVARVFKTL